MSLSGRPIQQRIVKTDLAPYHRRDTSEKDCQRSFDRGTWKRRFLKKRVRKVYPIAVHAMGYGDVRVIVAGTASDEWVGSIAG